MKRMIVFWLVLISGLIIAGFIDTTLSVFNNVWTANALILFTLMLGIEAGLLYYRYRMEDINETLERYRNQALKHRQDEHYVQHDQN